MIEIKLQFATIDQAIEALYIVQASAPVQIPLSPQPDKPEPAEAAPKRGRSGKKAETIETPAGGGDNNTGSNGSNSSSTETPEAVAVSVQQVAEEAGPVPVEAPAAASDKKYTLDDARQALSRLNDDKGLDAVRVLLAEFGANRISEVDPAKLGELVARCPAE